MCNHVHLLVTPTEAGGVGRLMQSLGRRYVGFFNAMMERTGTLWEGRFKSCLVDSEAYVLRCYRYIELNPVRAGIVNHPRGFRWSSYHRNGDGLSNDFLKSHPAYAALGASSASRAQAYRAIVAQGCPDSELESIRAMTQRQRVFGSQEFREKLRTEFDRELGVAKRGRPKKRLESEHGV
jgi:putative transposase